MKNQENESFLSDTSYKYYYPAGHAINPAYCYGRVRTFSGFQLFP